MSQKLCDTEHENVCSIKKGDTSNSVTELAGGLTHKIPTDKKGVELDIYDINGETKHGSQKIVLESTTVPINRANFKESEKATEYVQKTAISKKIVQGLPSNSPVNLKETSHCDSSNDDEL